MKFQGLPPHLHVGSAELTPVHPTPFLDVSMCIACGRAGPVYAICAFNHTICPSCSMPGHLSSTAWCPVCRRVVWVNLRSVSMLQLYQLEVRCSCGLEATLPFVREHLLIDGCPDNDTDSLWTDMHKKNASALIELSGGFDDVQPLEPPSSSPLSDAPTMKSSLPIEITALNEKRQIRKANQRSLSMQESERVANVLEIANMRQELNILSAVLPKLAEVLDIVNARAGMIEFRLENDWGTLMELLNKTSRRVRKNITAALKVIESRCASSTKAHFWFDYEKLYNLLGEHESIYSEKQYKMIAGIYFVTYIRIGRRNNRIYLGCFTGPTDEIESDVPWPLHRTIVISIHNTNGAVVISRSYDSYANGVYFNGFEKPKRQTGTGWHEFADNKFLQDNRCLVDGKLCVSVKVLPMEEPAAQPIREQPVLSESSETQTSATD